MDTAKEGLAMEIILISMSLVFFFALAFIIFFVVYQKRLLKQERTQQEKELMYQKELLQASIDGQEQERLRIAKELHDDVGTMLTTTKIYTGQLLNQLDEQNRIRLSTKMNELLGATIQSVREISHNLRPVILDKLGLHEAILALVDTVNQSGEIQLNYTKQGAMHCTKEQSINVYRILQELITNTMKHARAKRVSIQLLAEADRLNIIYKDDGIGLDVKGTTLKKGIGMKNIESRLSVLSGIINYENTASGFHAEMMIPLQSDVRR